MEEFNLVYFLLVISTLIIIYFGFLIIAYRKKKQLHYAFLALTLSMLIWNITVLIYPIFNNSPRLYDIYGQIYFLGTILVSLATLFTGLIFAQTKIKFTWKHSLLFIVPLISVFVLFTNQYHHLFYIHFGLIPSEQISGSYYIIHILYSYLCIGIGLAYFAIFSIKNYGFYSKQSLLISFGIIISLIFDSFSTFKIFNWSSAIENIVFGVTIICFILAILKFDFLNIIPIALQTVVDLISDGYVVINEDFEIIDYNKTFYDSFRNFERKDSIAELFKKRNIDFDEKKFVCLIKKAISEQNKICLEIQKSIDGKIVYFLIEIIPIFKIGKHIGTIILAKDITEHKNDIEQMTQLNEKLQSLVKQDALTQVYNRYYFDELLEKEIERVILQQCKENTHDKNTGFGLIMFDIDFFKSYNDSNGHIAGDELLQNIVVIVKNILSPNELLCRYGGEEFAVICSQISEESVARTAEQIRKTVEDHNFKFQETQPDGNLTISVGATYFSDSFTVKDDLIRRADNNLYLAKNTGRNKIIFR